MGRRKKGEPPAYRRHITSDRAYVTIDGKPRYLGRYGSKESREEYQRILRQWEIDHPRDRFMPAPRCTVDDLVIGWIDQVLPRLSHDEQGACRRNLQTLLEGWQTLQAEAFGPRQLEALRNVWVAKKHRRQTINKAVGRVRRVFRWAVSKGLVAPATLTGLEAVADLVEGELPGIEEYEDVPPVPLRDLARTIRACPPTLARMIRVGYYVGCRAGELCRMQAAEIDRQGIARLGKRLVKVDGWVFQPQQHKNLRKGKRSRHLAYVLGPRARALLAPALEGKGPEDYLWSPAVALAELRAIKRAARKTRVQPSQRCRAKRNPKRRPGECYTTDHLGQAIEYACRRAGVTPWSPGQLRHNYLSRADAAFGLQDASAAVGHARPDTTFGYIEKNLKRASEVAAKLG